MNEDKETKEKYNLEDIIKNVKDISDMYTKLAFGELKFDSKYRVTDNKDKVDEIYNKIFRDSIAIRNEHPHMYSACLIYASFIDTLIPPIKSTKRAIGLRNIGKNTNYQ
jgi:phosphate uptake regulator